LRRLPGLHELACGDGTPFADADTLAWIRKDVLGGAGGAGAGAPGVGGDVDPDALASARALAVAGNTAEALIAFDALLHGARSGRARFGVRLAMARAALSAGDEQLAAGLFSALYDEIERRGLDEWEPELAADCLAGYHECLTRGDGTRPEMAQRSALVYARLCRVDPRRALKASQ
jgi:type VI secretion system protein VasJ